jgi:SEC-C motif-containing protein
MAAYWWQDYMKQNSELCPCGSGKTYRDCCQLYHAQKGGAETAEDLMRSRYSAYVFGNEAYLLAT